MAGVNRLQEWRNGVILTLDRKDAVVIRNRGILVKYKRTSRNNDEMATPSSELMSWRHQEGPISA